MDELKTPLDDDAPGAQRSNEPRLSLVKDTDDFWKLGGKVWIPDDADELKLGILIEGHSGEAGHQ